jgi:hypothetical protein
MAVAGGAKPGQWMQVVTTPTGRRLTLGRTETTQLTESVMIDAIERVLSGERVCVDVYQQMHHAVARTVAMHLTHDRDDATHALCNVGALD